MTKKWRSVVMVRKMNDSDWDRIAEYHTYGIENIGKN